MNTGKSIFKYKKKYWDGLENQKFLVKMILIYLVCAILPILFMMYYYYISTTRLLNERAYSDGSQNMELLSNSLEMFFQPYRSIIERYKNDRNLNTLLSMDYTGMSYSDLAYYTNTQLDETLALYPEIMGIEFYNNNSTLPRDDYYFFPLSEIPVSLLEQANAAEQQSLCIAEDGEILLLAKMNYYNSSAISNFIVIRLDPEELQNLLPEENGTQQIYLLDSRNRVICASDASLTEQDAQNAIPFWQDLDDSQGNLQKSGIYYLKNSLQQGMTLVMTMDEQEIRTEASEVPMRMLLLFGIFVILLTIPALHFGRKMNDRMDRILWVTDQIGQGQFDTALEETASDELGLISRAINRMSRHIDRLIRENYLKELENHKSELNLLQEQINPHFLYNALAMISSMAILEKAPRTRKAARSLSDFYRISLNKGRQVITIAEEIELLKNYVQIQSIRFEDELEVSYEIEPEIEEQPTVKLILQPLVENAIIHGRSEEEERILHITVSAFKRAGKIVFCVADDGVGMSEDTLQNLRRQLQEQQAGFGLRNVDKRIKLQYGADYGITSMESFTGKGTTICMEIPIAVSERMSDTGK